MSTLQRHSVFRSDRIRVTECIIRNAGAKRVMEIGAGDYSFDYVNAAAGASWIKADFEPPCDVICDLNSDRLNLPFVSKQFDLLICTEVLEHLLWPQRLLREAHRLLCQDGKILVSVPNIASLSYRLAWMLGHIPSCAASANLPQEVGGTAYAKSNGEMIGGHVIDFNLERIRRLLLVCGFATVTVKGSGIIWHKQILPYWVVPASLASNIIVLARKM